MQKEVKKGIGKKILEKGKLKKKKFSYKFLHKAKGTTKQCHNFVIKFA